MRGEVEQFYDSLADAYHLIFEDWDRTIARQAHVLNTLIRSKLGRECVTIHDCACGIGTQAIGLAALGYRISGSDLSRAAIQRAAREAAKRGLTIEFRVSDMTSLVEYPSGHFDVLGAFDNALPHLSVDQLIAAAGSFRRVLRAEGIFIASIRDYDDLVLTRPVFQGPSFFGSSEARRIVHQVWDWTGADAYDVHQYVSLEQEGRWQVLHFSAQYRCLLRAELTQALVSAGFVDIQWLMPSVTGYYQPIVIGRAL
ncbi:MAG: class I SAM-dependent methyltransferase [Acidobacteriota bacterium]|nr:class I SAM-dependent methyltransferase [Acidobacteriota bacterium]